ncbi:MAG: hypothetical protein WBD05_00740, partial [Phycisphaerae bacterium]
ARADSVRTKAGIGYSGTVVGLDGSGLVLESRGVKRHIPLADIAQIRVDKYPDLARAEAAYGKGLAGGPGAEEAFARAERAYYKQLLRTGVPQWLHPLIKSRLFKLCTDSGRLRQAVDAYLEMAREHPELVAGLKLPAPKRGDSITNKAVLKKVEAALAEVGEKPYAADLERLRLALLLLEGKPEEVLPLLEPFLASENPKARRWATLKQLELLFESNKVEEAEARLEASEDDLRTLPHELAYYRGRLFEARGMHMAAALALLRVPILYPGKDRARTAEALWLAGRAMEAANLPTDEVVKIYEEARQDYAGTQGARRAARELERLGAG